MPSWTCARRVGGLLPATPPVRRGASTWRVRVEEWERFPGDRPTRDEMAEFGEAPVWEQRLVYADDIYL